MFLFYQFCSLIINLDLKHCPDSSCSCSEILAKTSATPSKSLQASQNFYVFLLGTENIMGVGMVVVVCGKIKNLCRPLKTVACVSPRYRKHCLSREGGDSGSSLWSNM